MKALLLATLVAACSISSAQELFTVRLNGIDAQVLENMPEHEYLSNSKDLRSGDPPPNIKMEVKNQDKSYGRNSFDYVDFEKSAQSGYAPLIKEYKVSASSKFDEAKDLDVIIKIPTTLDNHVWGKAVRKPGEESVEVVLDQYTRTTTASYPANTHWVVKFGPTPAKNGEFMQSVKAKGDWIDKLKREKYSVFMRNKGASEWTYGRVGLKGGTSNDKITAVLDDMNGTIDPSKEIEILMALITDQNNFLWSQVTVNAGQLGYMFLMDKFSGMPGDEDAPLRTAEDAVPDLMEELGMKEVEIAPSTPPSPPTPVQEEAAVTPPSKPDQEETKVAEPIVTEPAEPESAAPVSAVELKISMADDLDRQLLPGDRIAFHGGLEGAVHKNLKYSITQAGKQVLAKRMPFDPTLGEVTIPLANNDRLNLNQETRVTVGMETIFGNWVWTTVTSKGAGLNEPIRIDTYSGAFAGKSAPQRILPLSFEGKPKDKAIRKALKDSGDEFKKATNADFTILLKNEGDREWKVNVTGPEGKAKGGSIKATVGDLESLSFEKNVVVRTSLKTALGKFLWQERTVSPQQLHFEFRADQYLDSMD